MSGIRVSAGVRTIPVNDQGGTITLNLGDQALPGRVFAMLDQVERLGREAAEQETAIRASTQPGTVEQARALCACNEQLHRALMEQVDLVFGPDTCRTVFGDIVPGVEQIRDFFEQLIPIFRAYSQERAEKLSRYGAGRQGDV